MRIAAIEKMGYYPTPPQTLQCIATMLQPTTKGGLFRFLDPCAGQGEALNQVAQALRAQNATVQTYGVELSNPRCEVAQAVLDTCICADWADITCAHKGFSLLWLNPPYDTEAGQAGTHKRRLEYIFLQNTLKVLQPLGLLVYIVPLKLLAAPNVAKFLAGYFQDIAVFRLPAGEFEQFGQAVLFAYRKDKAFHDEAAMTRLIQYGQTGAVSVLGETSTTFGVPVATLPAAKFFIRKITLTPEEVMNTIVTHGVHTTKHWHDLLNTLHDGTFTPVVPLKTGHIGSLISSGQMGTVQLGGLLAKGRSIKVTDYLDAHGNIVPSYSPEATTERERFETRVFTLSAAGNFQEIASVEFLQAFLEGNAAEIANLIAQQYKPLYSQPTREEWNKLSGLLLNKRLPGRTTGGLLPAQKHVAIAASRSVQHQGWADIIGEMGTGKTCTSLAALEVIPNAYPAIVLCPGHMVQKWAREAEEVIPGCSGIVIDSLQELVAFAQSYTPGQKVVAVISKERAKLGAGWQPATIQRQRRLHVVAADGQSTRLEYTLVHTCPKCGAVITDEEGLPLRIMPEKRLHCTAQVKRWIGDPYDKTQGEFKTITCDEPLYEIGGFRRWPLSRYIRKKLKGFFKVFIADEFHLFKGKSTDQAGAYHDLVMAAKYTLNLTGTLFGGKSTDLFWLRYRIDSAVRSDFDFHDEIRWAELYGRLERTLQKEESASDGVFSGRRRYVTKAKEIPGISPAIFSRLLTSCIFVRITDLGWKLPPYDEAIVHIHMAPEQQQQYDWLNESLLAYVKIKGYSASKHERMVAQKLLGVWLQNCLGRPNSGFRPETVMYSVNKQMKLPVPVQDIPFTTGFGETDEPLLMADFMERVAAGAIKENDVVLDPEFYGEYALHLESVVPEGELMPKEQWLVDYCRTEKAQNRKVLLYVRQTGTRDIQPRLKQILEDAGLAAVILPDSVEPKKREAWIGQRVGEIDILITNPKKVETGLDLIQFCTCIFYELDYSLFTLWQAMRRVWRLGQEKSVKVLFPVYADTMESAALALMGRKMQAALLLYGDNAASAITDEAGGSGNDFAAELAARILDGEELSSDGITGLLKYTIIEDEEPLWNSLDDEQDLVVIDGAQNTESVQATTEGEVTQAPEVQTYEQFVRSWESWVGNQADYITRSLERAAKKRGRKKVSEHQLTLFSIEVPPEDAAPRNGEVQLQMALF
jgi:hypothetical protein